MRGFVFFLKYISVFTVVKNMAWEISTEEGCWQQRKSSTWEDFQASNYE